MIISFGIDLFNVFYFNPIKQSICCIEILVIYILFSDYLSSLYIYSDNKPSPHMLCYPLTSVNQLLAWTKSTNTEPHIATTPLQYRTHSNSNRRARVVHCHDMIGGYVDDRYTQLSANTDGKNTGRFNTYNFSRWDCIGNNDKIASFISLQIDRSFSLIHSSLLDIFIYFSHHRVTIPRKYFIFSPSLYSISLLSGSFTSLIYLQYFFIIISCWMDKRCPQTLREDLGYIHYLMGIGSQRMQYLTLQPTFHSNCGISSRGDIRLLWI